MIKTTFSRVYGWIGLLVLVNLGLVAWLWFSSAQKQPERLIQASPTCTLNQSACEVTFVWQDQEIRARLTLSPSPIPIAKPIQATLELSPPMPWSQVAIEITGVNMYMGFNRQKLTQTDAATWQGDTILAFCTEEAMVWQVQIQIEDEQGEALRLNFPLKTQRKPLRGD
jgi:hypothetical protein